MPRPGGTEEDDGVVLAPGVDRDGTSIVIVLDAKSWTQLACVSLPFDTPYRFHGIWLNASD